MPNKPFDGKSDNRFGNRSNQRKQTNNALRGGLPVIGSVGNAENASNNSLGGMIAKKVGASSTDRHKDYSGDSLHKRAHASSDVDSEAYSQHHTLGTGPTQAAAGDHAHQDLLDLIADLDARITALGG